MAPREPSAAVEAELQVLIPRARDQEYWHTLVPGLSTWGELPDTSDDDGDTTGDALAHQRLMHEGWCRGGTIIPEPLLVDIRRAIEAVHQAGWPTVFAFVYDALWWPSRFPRLHRFASTVLGQDIKLIPDFWAYYIPTSPRSHGYRPHREAMQSALLRDGSPTAITTWLPITDATVDNGCMYVLPRHLELENFELTELKRLYHESLEIHAHLHRARALPARAGTVLAWDHMVKHWGSFSSEDATHPRISIAFEWLRADVLPGVHDHTRAWEGARPRAPSTFAPTGPLPTFKQRLYLIGRNIKRYYESKSDDDVYQWMADVFLLSGFTRLGGR